MQTITTQVITSISRQELQVKTQTAQSTDKDTLFVEWKVEGGRFLDWYQSKEKNNWSKLLLLSSFNWKLKITSDLISVCLSRFLS